MAETLWVNRAPGQFVGPGPHVALPEEDGLAELLIGDLRVPDRVRCPSDPAMGADAGKELLVLGSFADRCRHPECAEDPHDITIFVVERGWFVGECSRTGFSWMRL